MGKLLLAGAIEGLGAGLGKAAEQRGKMAQEAERTARDITLQRMRDKAAMERTGEQEVGLSERQEARYGPGGFEEAAAGVKHEFEMKEIEARGKAQVEAARASATAAGRSKVQTVKYPIFDADGFQIGERVAHVFRDADTQSDWEQHAIDGQVITVPAQTYQNLDSQNKYLFDNPETWGQYKTTFGELPQWFDDYFGKFKSSRGKKKADEPTPGPGPMVAARGQVQRGEGGGGGTTPDLKERLLTRASEMQQ